MRIFINDVKVIMGQNKDEHNLFKSKLLSLIPSLLTAAEEIDSVQVYNLVEEYHNYSFDAMKQLTIFFNSTDDTASREKIILDTPSSINGIDNEFTVFLQPSGRGRLIQSPEGYVLAEFFPDKLLLNVLFNACKKYSESSLEIISFILSELNRIHFAPLLNRFSWKLTNDKESLVRQFKEDFTRKRKRELANERRNLVDLESSIIHVRDNLRRLNEELIRTRRFIDMEDNNQIDILKQLTNDLDLIVKHEKINDLKIKDGKFIIYTNQLFITDENGRRFDIGKIKIEIVMEETRVRFYEGAGKRGFWGEPQPHPHVSTSGEACLGNADSMVAELCAQRQLYALMLVLIDFLESVNLQDVAGKCITNWDEVDEDGNIINPGYKKEEEEEEFEHTCDWCDNDFNGEVFEVYDVDNDSYINVCPRCFENHAHYNEEEERDEIGG